MGPVREPPLFGVKNGHVEHRFLSSRIRRCRGEVSQLRERRVIRNSKSAERLRLINRPRQFGFETVRFSRRDRSRSGFLYPHLSVNPTRYHSNGGIVCIRQDMNRRSDNLGQRFSSRCIGTPNVRSWQLRPAGQRCNPCRTCPWRLFATREDALRTAHAPEISSNHQGHCAWTHHPLLPVPVIALERASWPSSAGRAAWLPCVLPPSRCPPVLRRWSVQRSDGAVEDGGRYVVNSCRCPRSRQSRPGYHVYPPQYKTSVRQLSERRTRQKPEVIRRARKLEHKRLQRERYGVRRRRETSQPRKISLGVGVNHGHE